VLLELLKPRKKLLILLKNVPNEKAVKFTYMGAMAG